MANPSFLFMQCVLSEGLVIQSFNVSVAAAIILAEASRQREAAGFYEQMRYTQEAYEAKLVDWLER